MKTVCVEVQGSGRHVHLCKHDFATLFGAEATLINVRDMGAGMFCAQQRLTIQGPKGTFSNVAILGPLREKTQVEISLTDARTLGIEPPIRMSGDLANSAGCTLIGPCGQLELVDGVIAAKRHIHLTPTDAETLGVGSGETVLLYVPGERALLFDEVVTRVDDKNDQSEVHLDIDEINAAKLPKYSKGWVFPRRDFSFREIGQLVAVEQ